MIHICQQITKRSRLVGQWTNRAANFCARRKKKITKFSSDRTQMYTQSGRHAITSPGTRACFSNRTRGSRVIFCCWSRRDRKVRTALCRLTVLCAVSTSDFDCPMIHVVVHFLDHRVVMVTNLIICHFPLRVAPIYRLRRYTSFVAVSAVLFFPLFLSFPSCFKDRACNCSWTPLHLYISILSAAKSHVNRKIRSTKTSIAHNCDSMQILVKNILPFLSRS